MIVMQDFKQLRYFTVLAEELHFGRAAERLNIVQPALSMQIKALEEDVGTPLLIRSPRSVRLTNAGKLLYQEASDILMRTQRALDLVKRSGRGEVGRLRLGASASALGSGILARIVRRFSIREPGVEISIEESHPLAQPHALLENDIDVSFGLPDAFAPHSDKVERYWLARFPIELVVSVHHELARFDSVSAADLYDEVFIGLSEADEHASVYLSRNALGYAPERTVRARSQAMMMTMVEANLGVAVVSAALHRTTRELKFLEIRDATISFDLNMFRRKDEQDQVVLKFWQTTLAG